MTVLLLVLLVVPLLGIHILRGGISLWLSLPCYGILALAAVWSFFPTNRLTVLRACIRSFAAAAAFLGYVIIRTVFSPAEYLARDNLFMVLGAVIAYLLTALFIRSPNMRGAIVSFLLALAIAHCVIGAIQFADGKNFMPFKDLPRASYGRRASGFLGSPNHLAGFLEITMLLGLALTFWSRWRVWAKVLLGYSSLVCLAGIILTGSRGGYISTVAGLLVFAVLSFLILAKQRFDRLGYVLGWLLGVLFVGGLCATLLLNESQTLRLRMDTATTLDFARLSTWPSAIQQFQLSPIFGTGSGTFLYYGRQFRHPVIQSDPQYAHNDYLQLLAEFGLVGLICFLVFLFVHVRSGWKALTEFITARNEFEAFGNTGLALTVGALSALAAIAVHSVVDFNMHLPANALVMAFIFGILAHPGSPPPRDDAGSIHSIPFLGRLVLPALGLWILIAGWPKFFGEYHAHQTRLALADWTTIDTGEYAVRAEKLARRGLKHDPKNTDLLSYLGESLAAQAALASAPGERERLYLESVAAYRAALRLAPMDRNLVLGLGWSLDPLQRFEESEPVFRRAVELDPNSGFVRWAYAAHLHRRGRLEEAEAEYQKAIPLASRQAHDGLNRLREERKTGQPGAVPRTTP